MAPPLLPSTRLIACPDCHEHVKSDASACPHCGADLPVHNRLGFAASALVGLALTGCPDKDMMTTAEPEYGVATTGPMNSTGNSSGGSTDGSTGATASGSGSGTSMTGPEPDYGIPTTAEPEYGVPTTEGTAGSTGGSTGGSSSSTSSTTAEPDYGVPSTTTGP